MFHVIQAHLAADLTRRAAALPQEIETWKSLTQANAQGMGIHRSQVAAINLMFTVLLETQTELLKALDPAASADDFTRQRMDLERQLSATHGLMGIFRMIMAQRRESPFYQRVLDAADLIAAHCYRTWMDMARGWGAVTESEFREPPLTYLNAMFSPAAITRRHVFSAFKVPLEGYLTQKLPISVISLPFHHTVAVWNFGSIYHEVGHPLDQDLSLREQLEAPLQAALQAEAQSGQPAKAIRLRFWNTWLREAIADTVGVLLGGGAFAYTLTNILYLPPSDVVKFNDKDVHPNPYARIFLLGQLLRQTGVAALAPIADESEQLWQTVYGQPAELESYVADCAIVARVLLTTPLATLKGHTLLDFGSALPADLDAIAGLARYLHIQFKRPDPKTYPYRLVPAAAQVAIRQVTDQYATVYAGIQERTLAYVDAIPRPEYLSTPGISPQRAAVLRGLVQAASWEEPDEDVSP